MPRTVYSAAEKKAYYAKRASVGKPKKKVVRSYVRKSSTGMIKGSGDYTYSKPGPWGKVGRAAGRAVGNYFGGSIGGAVGDKFGGLAHYIGKLFGSGDYKMNLSPQYNVLTNSRQIPQFSSGKMTNMICHREYIGDVITSSSANTFSNTSYPINAGLSGTFPWLSGVAANYEQYRVLGMVFEYRTMSADALNSTNTALGSVVMACEYNSANANFVNKQQMENYEFAVSCKPSESCYCAIECAKSQTPISELYVRDGSVPSGQDQKTYDLGNFQIATTGMQGTSVNVGELWVTFCIELLKPRLVEGNIGLDILSYKAQLQAASLSASHPLSTSITASTGNTLSVVLSPTTITFPSTIVDGQYLINYFIVGANTASVVAPSLTATSNCSLVSLWKADAASAVAIDATYTNSADISCIACLFVLNITGPGAVFTFGTGGTLPGTLVSGDLMITQFSSNISA